MTMLEGKTYSTLALTMRNVFVDKLCQLLDTYGDKEETRISIDIPKLEKDYPFKKVIYDTKSSELYITTYVGGKRIPVIALRLTDLGTIIDSTEADALFRTVEQFEKDNEDIQIRTLAPESAEDEPEEEFHHIKLNSQKNN